MLNLKLDGYTPGANVSHYIMGRTDLRMKLIQRKPELRDEEERPRIEDIM